MACHQAKHGGQGLGHRSNTTSCGGDGCHNLNNVGSVHAGGPGGGCTVCHSQETIPATTDCAVCHSGIGTDHHEAHNTAGHIPDGCDGCHFTYLDDEHDALGYGCTACHESSSQTVIDAIAAGDRACKACHPGNHDGGNGRSFEFNPNNGSGHRVTPDLPGMRSSFEVNGNTYSWTRPSVSTFLKTGWAYDSMVLCSDCHQYSGANGPHGAQMQMQRRPGLPERLEERSPELLELGHRLLQVPQPELRQLQRGARRERSRRERHLLQLVSREHPSWLGMPPAVGVAIGPSAVPGAERRHQRDRAPQLLAEWLGRGLLLRGMRGRSRSPREHPVAGNGRTAAGLRLAFGSCHR